MGHRETTQINPATLLCAGRSCCSQAGLLGSTIAGVHKFITSVVLEACHQGTKQKLLPPGISLRKGVQGLQFRSGAGGQEELCWATGALLRAQGPRMKVGSNPSLPFSCGTRKEKDFWPHQERTQIQTTQSWVHLSRAYRSEIFPSLVLKMNLTLLSAQPPENALLTLCYTPRLHARSGLKPAVPL